MFDQRAEHPPATRQIADRAVGLLVDSNGQELLKLRAILVEDPDRGVARSGDLPCRLKDTIEHSLLVKLGDERLPNIEQLSMPRSSESLVILRQSLPVVRPTGLRDSPDRAGRAEPTLGIGVDQPERRPPSAYAPAPEPF